MSLGRINGPMLQPNLERQGVNIAIDGNLTYWDVNNRYVGINTTTPNYPLDVKGNVHVGNLYIKGSTISTDTGYKLTLGNIANIVVYGGTANSVIITDGAGNLSYANLSQSLLGNSISIGIPGQGQLSNVYAATLTSTTNIADSIALVNQSLANTSSALSTLTIQVNGNTYAKSNVAAFLPVYGGSILADVITANSFVGNITGNLTGNVYGTIKTSAQPYITSLGNLTSLTAGGNISTIANVYASNFVGNVTGNVVGNISGSTATFANIYGNIATSSQPYITSVGILNNLVVSGQVTANVLFANSYTGSFSGNVSGNITGNGSFTNVSGTLTTGYQPYITSVGTLANLTVAGTITSGANIVTSGAGGLYGNLFVDTITPYIANVVTFTGNTAIGLPGGTTAARPNGVVGYIRYNSDLATVEFFNGVGWTPVNGLVADQVISPDGVNQSFSLSQPATSAGILVSINGTIQQPDIAYTVSGMTITFAEVPRPTDIVDVRYIATTGVTTLDYEIVTASAIQVNTITAIVDTFNVSAYRSARYTISSSNGTDAFMAEVMVLQNGGVVSLTTFGVLNTGSNTITFDANINGSVVNLLATGTTSSNQLRINKIYFDI